MKKALTLLFLLLLFTVCGVSVVKADDIEANWPKQLPTYPGSQRSPYVSEGQSCLDGCGATYYYNANNTPAVVQKWYENKLETLGWEKCEKDPEAETNDPNFIIESFYDKDNKVWVELDFRRLSQTDIELGLGPTSLGFVIHCERLSCFESNPNPRTATDLPITGEDNPWWLDFWETLKFLVLGVVRKII